MGTPQITWVNAGAGGMGEVYRADDLRLGQPVALKCLPPALAHDPVRLAQFHNEVRTARQVSHPNVCRVYDIGELDGQPHEFPWLAMSMPPPNAGSPNIGVGIMEGCMPSRQRQLSRPRQSE